MIDLPDLFSMLEGDRDGATYESEFDETRLNRQAMVVFQVMMGHEWLTLHDISVRTGEPEASISARLRDLRKERFGGHLVERRRHPYKEGLFLYRLTINHRGVVE